MVLTQALITAGGRGLKPYPEWDSVEKLLHPIYDVDGRARPVLQILADEAFAAGAEEIVLVVSPGDEERYRDGVGRIARDLELTGDLEQARELAQLIDSVAFVIQHEPLGFGHAVWCAREAIDGDHFLLLLSDHLFMGRNGLRCAAQLREAFDGRQASVSSVAALMEHHIHRYGVVAAQPVQGAERTWTVHEVLEKPSPTQAELACAVPGLRRGQYLCFSGLHILDRAVLGWLDRRIAERGEPDWMELTPVLSRLARERPYVAVELDGVHQNIGIRFGLVEAQLERALRGPDRDHLLRRILDIVARAGS